MRTDKKFVVKERIMSGSLEEVYIKIAGDNYGNLEGLLKGIKDIRSSSNKTCHAQVVVNNKFKTLLIETSLFNKDTTEYGDRELWLFTMNGPAKYDWVVNRCNN